MERREEEGTPDLETGWPAFMEGEPDIYHHRRYVQIITYVKERAWT